MKNKAGQEVQPINLVALKSNKPEGVSFCSKQTKLSLYGYKWRHSKTSVAIVWRWEKVKMANFYTLVLNLLICASEWTGGSTADDRPSLGEIQDQLQQLTTNYVKRNWK